MHLPALFLPFETPHNARLARHSRALHNARLCNAIPGVRSAPVSDCIMCYYVMGATLAVDLCTATIYPVSKTQAIRAQIDKCTQCHDCLFKATAAYRSPLMPIGVQLRPCFRATVESLPALARSWRGGGGLFFPRVSSLLFSSLVFLKGALCSPRALLLRVFCKCIALTPKLL